ncbi:MAG: DNA-3-methyladenine glycosylase [Bacteroidia bacterium]|nr:DNA-3-methyladenine glycosylase [Bacteroidia bacterium]
MPNACFNRLSKSFFERDVLDICPDILGKYLVRKFDDGRILRKKITEVEAYRGHEDLACHASKGRTPRTEIMFHSGGVIYIYLVYGMYWMLNIVSGPDDHPQALLIRSLEGCTGPGKVTKLLETGKDFYGEDLGISSRLWIEENDIPGKTFITTPRVGVDYAGDYWKNINWRFQLSSQ